MQVAVGTLNPIKLAAVREVLDRIIVVEHRDRQTRFGTNYSSHNEGIKPRTTHNEPRRM